MKVTSWKSNAPEPESKDSSQVTEKQDRYCVFYLNTETGEYKAYTSIKSLSKDKPEFKATAIYSYFKRLKTDVYKRKEHTIYRAKLHTY